MQRVRGLTGPNPFHSQALQGMFYWYPCFTDVRRHMTCLHHGGRAGLPGSGEYGEIDLRGQAWKWRECGKDRRQAALGAAFLSSPFLLYRRIKTWSMETCALKTSSWPARASTASAAHSSSSATPASPSLCCPDKVCPRLHPSSLPPPRGQRGKGSWGWGSVSFQKVHVSKCVSARTVPWGRVRGDVGCREAQSLRPLRTNRQFTGGTSGPCK